MRTYIKLLSGLLGILAFAPMFFGNVWAQESNWHIQKSSGAVWVGSSEAQPVALSSSTVLKPGDHVRTGLNGRVLLVRGSESILIAPNTVVGLPLDKSEGMSTTIIQQTGSILLEVEKRSQKHFEVETPYLVAVVKGTQFRVSVDQHASKVDVISGAVEVGELRSGRFATILPGQSATVATFGSSSLSISGTGTYNPIEQGEPRASKTTPWTGPKDVTPRSGGQSAEAVRIRTALGQVTLDVHKATNGMVRAATAPGASVRDERSNATRNASRSESGNGSQGNALGSAASQGNGGGVGGGLSLGNGGSGGGLGLGNSGGGGTGFGYGQVNASAVGQTASAVGGLGGAVAGALKGGCKGKGGC
jgi:hypothetical protein